MARDHTTTGHYISCNNGGTLTNIGASNGDYTVCGWFQIDSMSNGWPMMVTKAYSGGAYTFELRLDNSTGANQFVLGNGGGSVDVVTGHGNLIGQGWIWQCIRKTGLLMEIYGRHGGGGVHQCDDKISGVSGGNNGYNIHIGTRAGGDFWYDGRTAEVAIWNTSLSVGEMEGLGMGRSPSMVRPLNLVAYWPLRGTASPEPDFSGNNNSGTVVGAQGTSFHAPIGPYAPFVA